MAGLNVVVHDLVLSQPSPSAFLSSSAWRFILRTLLMILLKCKFYVFGVLFILKNSPHVNHLSDKD